MTLDRTYPIFQCDSLLYICVCVSAHLCVCFLVYSCNLKRASNEKKKFTTNYISLFSFL